MVEGNTCPDPISIRAMRQITREEANRLLMNPTLRAESARTGVDLGLIVSNMLLTLDERIEKHQSALDMVLSFRGAFRKTLVSND